ncbi:hypothetical protein NE236_17255 [Actinoallomurus purpureus]|uniref:hypothetical protein n=1 Tax=Actinoallomurus purpureus TaxID=478114 RepID=UPI0020938C32|nr:hypothetical protein [Actinoallomurus purpureus]MCO6006735.1 hypothetical protein [Actinoallomurus purpureus]
MHAVHRTVAGACLIMGPAIQGLSTFYWSDRHQGITAGALIVVATICWIVGLVAVYRLIEQRVPRYAALALPVAVYGCVGGASFGLQGMHEELFNVSHAQAVRLLHEHPAAAYVAFWFAGTAFPISVFVLGVVLTWIRAVPVPISVLIAVSAIAFPLSRIPREIAIAHIADLALLVPFAYLGARMAMGGLRPIGR